MEIKQIDLLAHPFFELGYSKVLPEDKIKVYMSLWKKRIDEIAQDKTRVLVIAPQDSPNKFDLEIITYASKKLGNQFLLMKDNGKVFETHSKKRFGTINEALSNSGHSFDKDKIKTKGYGQFTNNCVIFQLRHLNKAIGMQNPLPQKNVQSQVLWKLSFPVSHEHPYPWELKSARKNPARLRAWMNGNLREKLSTIKALSPLKKRKP
ncbi:MAG: hypothetical protein WC915_01210 [archaeon]|jgi:hypothetical protein